MAKTLTMCSSGSVTAPSTVSTSASTSANRWLASSISSSTVCPAFSFFCTCSTSDAKSSRHAITVNSCRPTRSSGMRACHRSLPAGCAGSIGTSCQAVSSAARQTTAAAILSCPSAKIAAMTSARSPTVRLTTKRPISTDGVTLSIATRGAADAPPARILRPLRLLPALSMGGASRTGLSASAPNRRHAPGASVKGEQGGGRRVRRGIERHEAREVARHAGEEARGIDPHRRAEVRD